MVTAAGDSAQRAAVAVYTAAIAARMSGRRSCIGSSAASALIALRISFVGLGAVRSFASARTWARWIPIVPFGFLTKANRPPERYFAT
jgi:hypothetical protein